MMVIHFLFKITIPTLSGVGNKITKNYKENDMAQITLTITSGANTIMIGDLANDKEVQIEIENGYKEYNSVHLDKESLIALREHLDYIINKLES